MFVFNLYHGDELIHYNIPLHGRTTFGRGDRSNVRLSDARVSLEHVSLEVRRIGGRPQLVLRDEGSEAGTFICGERVVERLVSSEATICIAPFRIEIRELHKNRLPTLNNDASQSVVFAGDPFLSSDVRSRRLRALYDFSRSLSDLPAPILLEHAAATVKRGLNFSHLCVLLRGHSGLIHCTSWNAKGPCSRTEPPISTNLVEQCLETGQAILSRSTNDSSSGAALCAPLSYAGKTTGAIYCTTTDETTHEDLQFVTMVAGQVAVALSRRQDVSQAKLEAVLHNVSEAVLVCDKSFNILACNNTARGLLGSQALVGISLEKALEGWEHNFRSSSAHVQKAFDAIQRAKTNESADHSLHGNIRPLLGIEREGWRYLVSVRDNTREQRSESARLTTVNQLAHKLRTPLTVMMGVLSLLEQQLEEPDEELRWMLEQGDASCSDMARLIDHFVELIALRIRTTSHINNLPFTDIAEVVEHGIAWALQRDEVSRVRIENHVEPGRYRVAVDVDRVVRCVAQIVDNTAKFAEKDICLSVFSTADENGLRIHFVDNGKGIPESELANVLGIFQQVDIGCTGQVPGTGLGLWWTAEILRAHNGRLEILSPLGDGKPGTHVQFVFPMDRVRVESSEERAVAATNGNASK